MSDDIDMTIADAIGEAIEGAVSDHAGMVTKWVAVVEYFETDGDRALWTLAGDQTKPWDAIGLLSYGEKQITYDSLCEGDDVD